MASRMGQAKAGGKKLRRCRPHITPPEDRKVKKGALYKKNGPRSRVFTWLPNPIIVEYYKNLEMADRLGFKIKKGQFQ